jgi:Uri superfamily endonuclease
MATMGITYAVEVAWGSSLEGLFRIDVSTIGGTDVISGWPADAGFEDVTDDCTGFATTRGRSDDLGQLLTGTCTITLRDQGGKYNPVNAGSSLYPNVKPMRAVRVKATYDGSTYGIFYGFIQSIASQPSPDTAQTVLQCADLFSWLSLRSPTISALGSTNTGAAIKAVLDEISWPGSLRSLDTGDSIDDFSADGTKTSMELIRELLEAEMGVFYIDGSGIATFDNRNARYASTASSSTLTGAANTLMQWHSDNDAATIFNAATFQRTGGTAQTATDTDSIDDFGRRDMLPVTSSYVATDAEALSRAQLRVAQFKDPKTPARAQWVSAASTSAAILARELGDRVTITETFGNTDAKQYFIEAIDHSNDVWDIGPRHLTGWLLSEVPSTGPFIIGVTGIGQGYIGA